MSPHIAIIDYKMGNLRSVQKGFEHAGVEDVVVTDDPAGLLLADRRMAIQAHRNRDWIDLRPDEFYRKLEAATTLPPAGRKDETAATSTSS